MSFRHFTARSREIAARRNTSSGGSDFSWVRNNLPIKLAENDSGVFMFLSREDEPLIAEVCAHTTGKIWKPVKCTAELPGFEGRCAFCWQEERETDMADDDEAFIGVRTTYYYIAMAWDFNWYVPVPRRGAQNQFNWVLWSPSRPKALPPEGSAIGGLRYFVLGPARWKDYLDMVGKMEDVCSCVADTKDPEASLCYVTSAGCPNCGRVIFDDEALGNIGSNAAIREEILQVRHRCHGEEEGGCYDPKNTAPQEYFLEPVFECAAREANAGCEHPEPLVPLMRPLKITRTGSEFDTSWSFEPPPSSFYKSQGLPSTGNHWADLACYTPPEEILAEIKNIPEDFSSKIPALAPEKQAKILGIKPHFDNTKPYRRR